MTKPFEIIFDFPVALSNLKISLSATVELHHSEPYFLVRDFHLENNLKKPPDHSVLPTQEIKRINSDLSFAWVHRDSGRESLLSQAIGLAIEKIIPEDELNSHLSN